MRKENTKKQRRALCFFFIHVRRIKSIIGSLYFIAQNRIIKKRGDGFMKKGKARGAVFAALAVLVAAVLIAAVCFKNTSEKFYTAEDFGFERLKSSVDFNENGADDYSDFVLGARKDAKNHPKYDGRYFDGGFPPDNIGVCTDVVWRAFKNAGYDLREMVDRDIRQRPLAYSSVSTRDKNIDFRRVRNLLTFFEKHAVSLTTDIDDIEQWQGGDIVIFNGDKHIGIVSDRRDSIGRTYIIHNGGQPNREENYLDWGKVSFHFRFDASKAEKDILVKWSD